eukprot:TRINITY_DN857_c0_g1_i1.p1 TRINITY_DN857_c0_g1~~TRINITY_DN857_c0_g1_i1.p1  ORF type:complete len:328 (+),score=100.24 TRINITY_DN857_c0_g1_i1:49-1032(+)
MKRSGEDIEWSEGVDVVENDALLASKLFSKEFPELFDCEDEEGEAQEVGREERDDVQSGMIASLSNLHVFLPMEPGRVDLTHFQFCFGNELSAAAAGVKKKSWAPVVHPLTFNCEDFVDMRPEHPPYVPPELFALDQHMISQEGKDSTNDTGDGRRGISDSLDEEKTGCFHEIRGLLDGLIFGVFCPLGDQFWNDISKESNGGDEECFWETMMQRYMKEWDEDGCRRLDEIIEERRDPRDIERAYQLWKYILSHSSGFARACIRQVLVLLRDDGMTIGEKETIFTLDIDSKIIHSIIESALRNGFIDISTLVFRSEHVKSVVLYHPS